MKFKITITAILIISAIMTVTTWRDIKEVERKLLDGQKEKATLLSDRIKHGIMVLMLEKRWHELQTVMEHMVKDGHELKEIRIFHPDSGIMLVSSDPGDIGKQIYKEDWERFQKQKSEAPFLMEKGGQQYASRLSAIPNLPACYKCHGSEKKILGGLDIKVSLTPAYQSIQKFKRQHLLNAFMGFLLITGAFLFVVGMLINKPIKRMIGTIKKIENGDLSVRMKADKKDELGQLAKSFNRMLESLESTKKEIEKCHRQQVQRAAKLASLGELASGIAHEIKNPLAGISGAIQVLYSDFDPKDPKKEILTEVLNQVKRLDRAVKDLLSYAKPTPPQMTPNNVTSILEKTIFFIRQLAETGKTTIETDFEKNLPDIILDADQIHQVFLNLSINAIHAMPEGGVLRITTALRNSEEISNKFLAEANNKTKWLEIKFEDTGVGISEEDIENIFTPFFTKKVKGTGLGLSISHRIVEDHGGRITVKSQTENGSVFTVFLPVRE